MGQDQPRWRIRLSTLMFLVIIAALAMALVARRMEAERARRQAVAALAEAQAARRQVEALLQQATKSSPPGSPAAGK